MATIDIGFLTIAILVAVVLFAVGAVANRFFHDRIFVGLTPGLMPPLGQSAPVAKVQPGREYSGEVAVAFSPPRGLRPGLVGTIVDGEAEMRDITATVVDLAVRGWVQIEAVDVDASRQNDPKKKSRDWLVTAVEPRPADDRLDPFEDQLLGSLFSIGEPSEGVLMSDWTRFRGADLRDLQNRLYAQTVTNGWYEKDPRSTSAGCLGVLGVVALIGYCLLMFASSLSIWTVLSAGILVAGAVFASRRLKRRVPRTALGTAAMVQSLGFKKYLATAEADQFSFEEAAGIFSRYLPYALVFGVADHWAKVFGEVAQASELSGGPDILDSLIWMDLTSDIGFNLAMFADGGFDGLFDLGDVVGGLGDVAEGIGGFVEGVGDFISDFDFDF
ncbi:Predicted membrane protein [Tessaracoccus bendigoensis DSM 12906]|uniref:Predicted membrane protein n=1 Tax=Tessaracoccus bendigoensis DSM 12906 TaxID=1123357 RepID=A0A1M6LVM4_9ACTN|nr:DUF2207 domain-containing protein [Tessaracoccus bendigoensis]SHJ75163.1 Predicted membrane protein [Tessaracoccus bendigoensis DSM 12906]